MVDMARREGPGEYQIGVYTVTRRGRRWEAWATGALGEYRKDFPSLAAAHLVLTGEPMREATARTRRLATPTVFAFTDGG